LRSAAILPFAFQAPILALRRIPIASQNAFRYSTTIPQHLLKPTPEGEHHEHRQTHGSYLCCRHHHRRRHHFATAADDRADFAMPADKVVAVAKADTAMPTVTVSAKRLTAAEKAAL
jgi:hypothetical protein